MNTSEVEIISKVVRMQINPQMDATEECESLLPFVVGLSVSLLYLFGSHFIPQISFVFNSLPVNERTSWFIPVRQMTQSERMRGGRGEGPTLVVALDQNSQMHVHMKRSPCEQKTYYNYVCPT